MNAEQLLDDELPDHQDQDHGHQAGHNPAEWPMAPIPVKTTGQDHAGGHQGIHFTAEVSTGTNPVIQLLPRDYDRLEARVLAVDQPIVLAQSREMAESAANQVAGTAAASVATQIAFGNPTNPAAGAAIASVGPLPAGNYTVYATMMLGGSTGVGDNSNVQVQVNATVVGTIIYTNTTAVVNPPSPPIVVTVPAGGTVSLNTIGASGATTIYRAQLVVTPLSPAAAVAGPPAPVGSYQPAGLDRTFRNCDEVWAAATSATPTRISVIVSRRLALEHPAIA